MISDIQFLGSLPSSVHQWWDNWSRYFLYSMFSPHCDWSRCGGSSLRKWLVSTGLTKHHDGCLRNKVIK